MQLHDLVGEPLSAVSFVQDYVELHFDGPVVRCLVGPVLKSETFQGTFPAPGSRDALCSLISQSVRKLTLEDEVKLEIEFSSGAILSVPLDYNQRRWPEAMHFVPHYNGPVQVW